MIGVLKENIKGWFCFLLVGCFFFLSACSHEGSSQVGASSETTVVVSESAENTTDEAVLQDTASEISSEATDLSYEDAPKNENWQGYTGYIRTQDYVHLYSDERNKKWEDAILSFANNYLSPVNGYPALSDRDDVRVRRYTIKNGREMEYKNLFNQELHDEFASSINDIILKISSSDNADLLYSISETLTMLKEVHTSISIPMTKIYGMRFMPLYKEGKLGIYCISALKEDEKVIGSELIAINGVKIDDVVQKMKNFEYTVDDEQLVTVLSRRVYRGKHAIFFLYHWDALQYVGVIDKNIYETNFTFQSPEGEKFDILVKAVSYEENEQNYDDGKFVEPVKNEDFLMYQEDDNTDDTDEIFNKYFPEYKMMYVRVSEFGKGGPFQKKIDAIFDEVSKIEHIEKFVLDVRYCPGGYFNLKLLRKIKNAPFDKVYVLIDGMSASTAPVSAELLRRETQNTLLVGSSTFPANTISISKDYEILFDKLITLPEYGDIEYLVPIRGVVVTKETEPLVPDVEIHWQYDDYFNKKDTVLEWVKSQ